jgi:hypothetical protein
MSGDLSGAFQPTECEGANRETRIGPDLLVAAVTLGPRAALTPGTHDRRNNSVGFEPREILEGRCGSLG